MEIRDNFLDEKHLVQLESIILGDTFPWYLQKEQVPGTDDGCLLLHTLYDYNVPRSEFYATIDDIFWGYLNYVSLCRVQINLLLRQNPPSISGFHTDWQDRPLMDETKITTAIFYLNTNNGTTEFKDGTKVDAVKNRLVMFPAITPHRAIGQTDITERIVLNFNFIKSEG
jgi:hypothetical protein